MNFVADESIDQPIVENLRQDGHDVVSIAELSPSLSDEQVLNDANSRGAILLTADKDFGELVFRQNQIHNGVILIRLSGLGLEAKAQTVSQTIKQHAHELTGAFCVISAGSVRIRHSA